VVTHSISLPVEVQSDYQEQEQYLPFHDFGCALQIQMIDNIQENLKNARITAPFLV
jgi:predicted alpha/beta hydrolase family esterase